jgi:hypothetical protein
VNRLIEQRWNSKEFHLLPKLEKLVTRSAGADAGAAANQVDGVATILQLGLFSRAESGILRTGFSDGEVAVLDVSRPRPHCRGRNEIARAGRIRAGSALSLARDDLDHASVENRAVGRVAGQIAVDREGPQTIGRDQAAAAFRHFFVGIEHEDSCAEIATGRAGVIRAYGCVWSASCVGIGKIIDLQNIGRGRSYRKCRTRADGQSQCTHYKDCGSFHYCPPNRVTLRQAGEGILAQVARFYSIGKLESNKSPDGLTRYY